MLVCWLVDFQRCFMDSLGDVFKTLRRTVWHWINLTDTGKIFRPKLLLVRKMLLKVPETGISSHFRMY